MFTGIAEVVGGVVMGWISDHLGRSTAVIVGSVVYGGGLTLAALIKYEYILNPTILSIPLAAFAAAFCFGIGDCTFNTQTYAILGQLFGSGDTVAAFTIFQFTQNIGSAVGYFYAPHLPLHGKDGSLWQVGIQAGVMVAATLLFIATHWGWNTAGRGLKNGDEANESTAPLLSSSSGKKSSLKVPAINDDNAGNRNSAEYVSK